MTFMGAFFMVCVRDFKPIIGGGSAANPIVISPQTPIHPTPMTPGEWVGFI